MAKLSKDKGGEMKIPSAGQLTKWRIEVDNAAADCGPRDLVDVPALVAAMIPGATAFDSGRYGGALLIYGFLFARDVGGLTQHVNLAATATAEAAAFAGDVVLPRENVKRIWRREIAQGHGEGKATDMIARVFSVPYKHVAARVVDLELIPAAPERRSGGAGNRPRLPNKLK